MGFVFALGWTPCVGPLLGAVLTYTASQTSDPWMGGFYLFIYGMGFATPLLVISLGASTLIPLMRRMMKWLTKIEKGTGFILAGVGLYVMISVTSVPQGGNLNLTSQTQKPNPLTETLKRKYAPIDLGAASEKPRMVKFTSADCPICRQMIPVIGVVERECSLQRQLIQVLKIDVGLHPELAQRFRIRGVPTFVFLNQQGTELARLVGYQHLSALRQGLSLLTGDVCRGIGHISDTQSDSSAPASDGGGSNFTQQPNVKPATNVNQNQANRTAHAKTAAQPSTRPAPSTPQPGSTCPGSTDSAAGPGVCRETAPAPPPSTRPAPSTPQPGSTCPGSADTGGAGSCQNQP
jgi:thiol-disulfide isomerase/thioredoxin